MVDRGIPYNQDLWKYHIQVRWFVFWNFLEGSDDRDEAVRIMNKHADAYKGKGNIIAKG